MTFSTVSAFCIVHTSLLYSVENHLSSFAMWTAFPSSDYYEGSVTIGVSPPP